MSKKLCDVCKAIPWSFFNDFAWDTRRPTSSSIAHQPTFAALREADEDGCPLCGLIHHAILSELKRSGRGMNEDVERGDSLMLRCDRYYWKSPFVTKSPTEAEKADSHPIFGLKIRFRTGSGAGMKAPMSFAYVPAGIKELSSNRNTSDLRLMKKWLSDCTMNHDQCKAPNDHPFNFCPTRLLDLDTAWGSPFLKLVETKSNPSFPQAQSVKYIALSYCWGKDFPAEAMTVKSNYQRNLTSILLLDLPETYKDAIRLARELGVRYIWIDALCIIQDSPEDWQRESPTMAQVYSSSLFTLAVESASSVSEGSRLHVKRDGREKAFFLKQSGSTASNYNIIYFTPHSLTEWYFFDDSTLRTRGWAYQERKLSVRKIHVSVNGIRWMCNESSWNNEVPWGWRLSIHADLYIGENSLVKRDRLPESSLANIWGNIVTEYSMLNLTKESDKLPALSGLADRMCFKLKQSLKETVGDTNYVAGLWNTSYLIPSLLWMTRGLLFLKRPQVYLAPSWSWVSIHTGVKMPNNLSDFDSKKHQASEVLDVSVRRDGLNPYGELLGGFIRIKGRFKAATSLGSDHALYRSLDNDSDIVRKEYQAADIKVIDKIARRCVAIIRWDMNEEGVAESEIYCLRLCLNFDDPQNTVHCIQLDTEKTGSTNFAESMGLALVPVGTKGEYRRVGVILRMSEDWLDDCKESITTII